MAWWLKPVILATWRPRQEDYEIKVYLGYLVESARAVAKSGVYYRSWLSPVPGKQAGADLQRTEQGGDTEVIGLGSPNLMELYDLIGDYHKDQGQAAQEPREQRHIF